MMKRIFGLVLLVVISSLGLSLLFRGYNRTKESVSKIANILPSFGTKDEDFVKISDEYFTLMSAKRLANGLPEIVKDNNLCAFAKHMAIVRRDGRNDDEGYRAMESEINRENFESYLRRDSKPKYSSIVYRFSSEKPGDFTAQNIVDSIFKTKDFSRADLKSECISGVLNKDSSKWLMVTLGAY